MTTFEAKSPHVPTPDREPPALETYFKEMFPHNPYAEELNMAMAMNVLARCNRTAYSTRSPEPLPWVLGNSSQEDYTNCIEELFTAGKEKLGGTQRDSIWHRLVGIVERRPTQKTGEPVPLTELLQHIGDVSKLQRRFLENPHQVTGDNIYTLFVFSRLVRIITEETVVDRLSTPYLETDVVPPDSLAHPELLREFTSIGYWRSDAVGFDGPRQRAHKSGSIVAMQMISLHQIITGQSEGLKEGPIA